MLNWVAILRRLLNLYGVQTQQELGMAIGVPFHLKLEGDGDDDTIPWPILELVVAENDLSWDWLLTGKYYRGPAGDKADEPNRDDAPPKRKDEPARQSGGSTPPRIETRELARRLLAKKSAENSAEPEGSKQPEEPAKPEPVTIPAESDAELEAELRGDAEPPRRDDVLDELESIRTAMQKELERVESILRDRRPRES